MKLKLNTDDWLLRKFIVKNLVRLLKNLLGLHMNFSIYESLCIVRKREIYSLISFIKC